MPRNERKCQKFMPSKMGDKVNDYDWVQNKRIRKQLQISMNMTLFQLLLFCLYGQIWQVVDIT